MGVPIDFGAFSRRSPNRVPFGGFAQGDQFDERADMLDRPSGSRPLHAEIEQLLHGPLHRTTANAPALRQSFRVVQYSSFRRVIAFFFSV